MLPAHGPAAGRPPGARSAIPRQAWQTRDERVVRWQRDATWDHLVTAVQTTSAVVRPAGLEANVDSSIARAHQRCRSPDPARQGHETLLIAKISLM